MGLPTTTTSDTGSLYHIFIRRSETILSFRPMTCCKEIVLGQAAVFVGIRIRLETIDGSALQIPKFSGKLDSLSLCKKKDNYASACLGGLIGVDVVSQSLPIGISRVAKKLEIADKLASLILFLAEETSLLTKEAVFKILDSFLADCSSDLLGVVSENSPPEDVDWDGEFKKLSGGA